MPREDDVGIFNGRLFHHLIDEKRNGFFYAYQYERKVSKDFLQNGDFNKICQKRNLDINHIEKTELT